MAIHSSIPAWEIPRTEEAGGLRFIGLPESDRTQQLNNEQPSTAPVGDKTHHTTKERASGLSARLSRFKEIPAVRSDECPQYPTLSPQTHSLLVTPSHRLRLPENSHMVTFTHLFVSLLEHKPRKIWGLAHHPPLNQKSLLHSRQSISIC